MRRTDFAILALCSLFISAPVSATPPEILLDFAWGASREAVSEHLPEAELLDSGALAIGRTRDFDGMYQVTATFDGTGGLAEISFLSLARGGDATERHTTLISYLSRDYGTPINGCMAERPDVGVVEITDWRLPDLWLRAGYIGSTNTSVVIFAEPAFAEATERTSCPQPLTNNR